MLGVRYLQFEEERYKVMYKRPTDLALIADVPVCCNLIIANILDEGGWWAGCSSQQQRQQ